MMEEQFSPQDSILLIRSMINKTREDISDNSIHFLVWGWITFIACMGQFILKHVYNYEKHYMVWWLVLVGVAFSAYYGIRESRTRKVKTYVADSIKYLWIGMGISYFVLSMILSQIGWATSVFPFFILLYGLGTFISGCFLRFKPLVIGGITAWALAIGSVYVSYDYQILFGALAIFVSYIVPAYLLRFKIRKARNSQ